MGMNSYATIFFGVPLPSEFNLRDPNNEDEELDADDIINECFGRVDHGLSIDYTGYEFSDPIIVVTSSVCETDLGTCKAVELVPNLHDAYASKIRKLFEYIKNLYPDDFEDFEMMQPRYYVVSSFA